jgi:hypothetical protein
MTRLLLLLLIASPVSAQSVTPNFTTGSMTQTVTATQTITETVAIERYGGAVSTWNGDNVQPTGDATASSPASIDLTGSSAQFYVVNPSEPWQLEIITRAAGLVETEDITRTIETDTVTNTLSVFSQ